MWKKILNFLFSWINFKRVEPAPVPTPTPEPTPEPLPPQPEPVPERTIEEKLLSAHNEYRATAGLEPLVLNDSLIQACKEQAKFMNDTSRTTHLGRGNTTHAQRAKKYGYKSGLVAENVAMCPCEIDDVMQLWINSRGHRQNILGPFQEVGFAKVGDYWCSLFGG